MTAFGLSIVDIPAHSVHYPEHNHPSGQEEVLICIGGLRPADHRRGRGVRRPRAGRHGPHRGEDEAHDPRRRRGPEGDRDRRHARARPTSRCRTPSSARSTRCSSARAADRRRGAGRERAAHHRRAVGARAARRCCSTRASRRAPSAASSSPASGARTPSAVRGRRPRGGCGAGWRAGAGAWAALALAGAEPFRRRAGAFAAWWALTWLMLDWHIGMVETEDGRERNLGPADACTLARVWLVPAAADAPAPWMCALAFVTDGLDGRLARASEPTRIGRDLEGLADWAFAAAALRGAVRRGWLSRGAGARRARAARDRPRLRAVRVVRLGERARPRGAARRARDDAGARRRARRRRSRAPPPRRRARSAIGGAAWSALAIAGACAPAAVAVAARCRRRRTPRRTG